MGEWQPIESAPSDPVLLYFPAVQINENPVIRHREQVLIARVSDYGAGQSGPTHWMPLPAPPSSGLD